MPRRTRSRSLSPSAALERIRWGLLGWMVRRLVRNYRTFTQIAEQFGAAPHAQPMHGWSRPLNTLRMANNSGNYEYRRLGVLNAMTIRERDRRPVDPPATFDGEEWPDIYQLAVRRRLPYDRRIRLPWESQR